LDLLLFRILIGGRLIISKGFAPLYYNASPNIENCE